MTTRADDSARHCGYGTAVVDQDEEVTTHGYMRSWRSAAVSCVNNYSAN